MRRRGLTRGQRITLWCFVVFLLVPAGYGFFAKLIQFFLTLQGDGGGEFTLVPILTYLFVAFGMVCLLVWATAHGMFRDVEGPKYDMLERERNLDRDSEFAWPAENGNASTEGGNHG